MEPGSANPTFAGYNYCMHEMISSHGNPIVKKIRTLHQKKGREESGLFLVEGIHPVGEIIEAGWKLDSLIYAPDLLTSDFARHLVAAQREGGRVPCHALRSELFIAVTGKENPQGILAIANQRHLALKDAANGHITCAVALAAPQDPGNVGTILRTLDAFGGDGLFLLDGGVEPHHPGVVRASMGTLFWIPVVQASFDDFNAWRRKNGYLLVGSSAHGNTDYRQYQWESKPTILLLGNEQKGLSAAQISACDKMLMIPMKGRSSSLNLAVAAGILMERMLENK
jgi:RNA methyltransferase, TrmH family